jgi:hypothetical protein
MKKNPTHHQGQAATMRVAEQADFHLAQEGGT